jgi:nitronate monooxygenase
MKVKPGGRFSFDELEHPIVQAPLAGGPSTPALAAAVTNAGGLGFLAAGYKDASALSADIDEVRRLTNGPFGVNLFAPPGAPGDAPALERYADELRPEAERYGIELGEPRYDDDDWEAKLAALGEADVRVVSITFGCPAADVVDLLHETGAAIWVTVTTVSEALLAQHAGADALVVQGVEAGGHRGSFDAAEPGEIGLLALLQLVGGATELPLVAAGGVSTGRGMAAVLAAGAVAAQLGTAFMLTPEAGTSPPHREALVRGDAPTALTRAFTGRVARGVINRFVRQHSAGAPCAYPAIHHLTSPIRVAAREREDADGINLWAGQAYPLVEEEAAGELVHRLAEEALEALLEAARRARREG